MAEGTFNPDASMHYQMDAVMNMQASLMNEEMVNSLSLIKISDAMQDAGTHEFGILCSIYSTGKTEFQLIYAVSIYAYPKSLGGGVTCTLWSIAQDMRVIKAPGWGTTGANEETSAAASIEQEYSQMITTSEKSISSAFQQMISQDKQSENGLSSFAQNGFLAQKSYSANLMASNLG